MPGPRSFSRSALAAASVPLKSVSRTKERTLLVVDNRPLQRAAWAELHEARKRMEKASRELHRHEEVDVPAYDSWLHRTFPVLVTTLRQLHQEILLKSHQVELVQALSYATGRSLKKLWKELKEREANPEAFKEEPPPEEILDDEEDGEDWDGGWDALFEDNDDEKEKSSSRRSKNSSSQKTSDFEPAPRQSLAHGLAAKQIYRRLVQRLHPDRGGEWTPTRQHLWHQVQQAWASGDTDWLTRLEVEWETTNAVLSERSPLSRLRLATKELETARRDIERKLREYRTALQWRFTRSEKNRATLHRRTEENFRHDISFLRRQLDHLNTTIAAWERTPSSVRHGQRERVNGTNKRRNSAPRR